MSGSTPSITYLGSAGVLPEVLYQYSASGSTPVLKNYGTVPLLHSHKSGIVLPGVLPNKLKLYSWSDLDMIQGWSNKFAHFLRDHISNNKAWNPIKLGVKWKLLFSLFWGYPWMWDLDLDCLRYARKCDSNRKLNRPKWLYIVRRCL